MILDVVDGTKARATLVGTYVHLPLQDLRCPFMPRVELDLQLVMQHKCHTNSVVVGQIFKSWDVWSAYILQGVILINKCEVVKCLILPAKMK
jgi:hypothetical protein